MHICRNYPTLSIVIDKVIIERKTLSLFISIIFTLLQLRFYFRKIMGNIIEKKISHCLHLNHKSDSILGVGKNSWRFSR